MGLFKKNHEKCCNHDYVYVRTIEKKVTGGSWGNTYYQHVYRCTKCGYTYEEDPPGN